MIKWPFRTYTHFMHYPFREQFDHTAEKKNVTNHSDLRETLVCFSFWCCCYLVCAHYIEQFERNTLNGEKKNVNESTHIASIY